MAPDESAAGALKQRNTRLGLSHPILVVPDDLRTGPLEDAGQPVAPRRTAWHKTIWRAQWWFDSVRDEAALLAHRAERLQRLLSALAAPDPVVVWMGNGAHDKLMLAMAASRAAPRTALLVADITEQVAWPHPGPCAVGACPPDALLHLVPRPLPAHERMALAAQWADWKRHGQGGWRTIDANGQMTDYPPDHLDADLLARVAAPGWPATHVVGEILRQHPGAVPADFLYWRLDVLRQAGRVVYLPGAGPGPQAPRVAPA